MFISTLHRCLHHAVNMNFGSDFVVHDNYTVMRRNVIVYNLEIYTKSE